MKCYKCGKAEFREEHGAHDYRTSGLPYSVILVGVPMEACPVCKEQVVTIPDPEGLHRVLALSIVETDRPLVPQEIRFLRKVLDKSAEEMAALMGVDEKTISRWENGKQKAGRVAERLLRLMVHQRLAPEATSFVDEVFPHLHDEGEASPLKFAASSSGWSQAA